MRPTLTAVKDGTTIIERRIVVTFPLSPPAMPDRMEEALQRRDQMAGVRITGSHQGNRDAPVGGIESSKIGGSRRTLLQSSCAPRRGSEDVVNPPHLRPCQLNSRQTEFCVNDRRRMLYGVDGIFWAVQHTKRPKMISNLCHDQFINIGHGIERRHAALDLPMPPQRGGVTWRRNQMKMLRRGFVRRSTARDRLGHRNVRQPTGR